MQRLGYRKPTDVAEPAQLVLVEYVSDDRVAIITLNRPHADNAITTQLAAQLIEILETIDQISRGAPCFIQAWAPKDERTAPQGATIALAYAQLAAHALGLGSSWSGGINTAAQAYPPLIELLGLPEGTVSYGTILLGYPAEQFQKIPARKPLNVTWL